MYRVAHNCHGKRINRAEKKKNNFKAKVKDSYKDKRFILFVQ